MNTVILRTATLLLVPLMMMYSWFLLLRGHDLPGGGFVGGLACACAFVLYSAGYGVEATLRILRLPPRVLMACGLLLALTSGVLPMLYGKPFLTGLWYVHASGLKVGSSLPFDIGVYLVVLGSTLTLLLELEKLMPRGRV